MIACRGVVSTGSTSGGGGPSRLPTVRFDSYQAVQPPSTVTFEPVTYDEAGEAR